ncbi:MULTISPECIES: molybdopterin cofactor-binding domain-containing protein [Pseudonocardia]|uniref:Isoquinoline 1-oxidoreductase subunit beta n=2 Tax=Pseudonocardia TaxID=1847 RepID=A0A1Y2MGG5_PSEAH|nr:MULTISPECIES: molybdopterin cofactor-binding domain-containing protein [Pseudonocardia]OSY34375.1 Isoquinoline 1-oxidoreductase subunit beta [Pseudonocardia autotrophica]TDN75237.1 isoquinoline 1-oxidoreductase beta subunit [Pseudonocardia autotrophica]BBF99182.1 isoquinoline 1-oxidoreductase subunit beta [Pseudonocardia autotrophica]GEC29799.1 isoquinoline 1-oxidoreductase subunit beta [Pseudonocardia saturnea]
MPAHRAPAPERPASDGARSNVSRRRFLGFLVAAPTLVVAAELGRQTVFGGSVPQANAAAIPSPPLPAEVYDLLDAVRDAARPTANLIRIAVNRDGTVSFALPRSDNGQGIITSTQMIIAEEMNLDPDQVVVTLADARPELVFNQLTGGSTTTFSTYTPIRVAAALAQGRLLDAAAAQLGQEKSVLTSRTGLILGQNGEELPFGELTEAAASPVDDIVDVVLKPREEFTVIGTPRTKSDARAMVTGKKKFLTDLQVPDALPTVICRGPNLNSAPTGVNNIDEVRNMPGVTDVAQVRTGVAVRAVTFGQAVDAVNALDVSWDGGTVAGEDDESILATVRRGELPLAVPQVPGETVEGEFVFYFRSNSALETNCAIADVRSGSAELWGPSKSPIAAQAEIAQELGLPQNAVTIHVTEGGGSFGRRLFFDALQEAAEVSKVMGKPVKLMWTRADDSRQGRVHPLATTRVRAQVSGESVSSFEIRHTSVSTEVNPGFSEGITAAVAKLPLGNYSVSQAIYLTTQTNPYNVGVATSLLNEVDMRFNTCSMRNIYSPDTATARELMIDQVAARMGKDPYEFRSGFVKLERFKKVVDRAAEEANWGKSMPAGTAQGIAIHQEYKGIACAVVELDCRPETVNREIRSARTGPRVTKVTYVVDIGLVINPRGLEAQMMGGINDGIAMTLTSGMHLEDGHFVEASWDNYFYTRQWNTPPEMNIVIIDDSEAPEPGGAGEFGVAATCGAVACAYARATGTVPEYFPIMHKDPLPFEPYPTVPPVPPAPTNGLELAR